MKTIIAIVAFLLSTLGVFADASPSAATSKAKQYLLALHDDGFNFVRLYERPVKSVIYFFHGLDQSKEATALTSLVVDESGNYDSDLVAFFGVDLDTDEGKILWKGITKVPAVPSKYPRFVLINPGPGDHPKPEEAQKTFVVSTSPFPPAAEIEANIKRYLNEIPVATTSTAHP